MSQNSSRPADPVITVLNANVSLTTSEGKLADEIKRMLTFLRSCDWTTFDDFLSRQSTRGAIKGLTHINQDQCKYELWRFLVMKALCRDYEADMISPSPLVDELWHTFLLFPALYLKVCHGLLQDTANILNHNPNLAFDDSSDPNSNSKRFQRYMASLVLYKIAFKTYAPTEFWPKTMPPARSSAAVSPAASGEDGHVYSRCECSDVGVGKKSSRRDEIDCNFEITVENAHDVCMSMQGDRNSTFSSLSSSSSSNEQDELILIVKDKKGAEINFRVLKSTRLYKVLNSYAENTGLDIVYLRFTNMAGVLLDTYSTPSELKLKDQDVVNVKEINPQDTLTIALRDESVNISLYKIKYCTRMGAIMKSYASRMNMCEQSFFLLLHGEHISRGDTPALLFMDEGDEIDVCINRGGC